jgi:xanthine dehydrogenase small subunit
MPDKIKFLLDEQVVEIDFKNSGTLRPTTTLLHYLRSLPGHKGVKEGCGEGDCGACTVVLGEPGNRGKVNYKAVDSCLIFLPMIHGKMVVTVENLAETNGTETRLHPVQEAMVNTNGSQCGYCTPGIVMSMFALYKNFSKPTKDMVLDGLTGNLCRCTGYKPIIEAAQIACKSGGKDKFSAEEKNIAATLKKIGRSKKTLALLHPEQKYYKAFTLKDALQVLLDHPNVIIINGATDIALRVTKKHELIPEILDISSVEELQMLNDTGDALEFGAGIKLEELKSIAAIDFPALTNMLTVFGSKQIRSLATAGGNLGSASPIGDTLPVLMAYDASVVLESLRGARTAKLREFVTAYRTTVKQPDELITRVIIPKVKDNAVIRSYKVSKRKDLDISTVSGCFRLMLNDDNTIKEIVLAFGGMAAMTMRAVKTEQFLLGKSWVQSTVEEAMEILYTEFTPISDARSGEEFRRLASRNLLLRFFLEITN